MKKYIVSYEFEEQDANAAAQAVVQSFFLADIEATAVTVGEMGKGDVFNYPYTKMLIEGLNERSENE